MKKYIYLIMITLLVIACEKEVATVEVRTTAEIAADLPLRLASLANIFDGEGVGAVLNIGLSGYVVILFNKSGTRYAWYEDGEIIGVREVKADDSHFKDFPYPAIGAAININHYDSDNNNVYLFNEQGTEYAVARINQSKPDGAFYNRDYLSFSGNVYSINDWGEDGSFPFEGVGSILHYHAVPNSCENTQIFSNPNGTELTFYHIPSETFYSTIKPNEYKLWNCNSGNFRFLPIEEVGAMALINPYLVFFDPDGKSFSLGKRCLEEFTTGYQLYE